MKTITLQEATTIVTQSFGRVSGYKQKINTIVNNEPIHYIETTRLYWYWVNRNFFYKNDNWDIDYCYYVGYTRSPRTQKFQNWVKDCKAWIYNSIFSKNYK